MSQDIARVWAKALPIGPMFAIEVGQEPVCVGSSPRAHVRVNHASVANTHATLRLDPRGYVAVHDHSSTGTFLDGVQVDGTPLVIGAVLSLGNAIRFRIEGVDVPRELRDAAAERSYDAVA